MKIDPQPVLTGDEYFYTTSADPFTDKHLKYSESYSYSAYDLRAMFYPNSAEKKYFTGGESQIGEFLARAVLREIRLKMPEYGTFLDDFSLIMKRDASAAPRGFHESDRTNPYARTYGDLSFLYLTTISGFNWQEKELKEIINPLVYLGSIYLLQNAISKRMNEQYMLDNPKALSENATDEQIAKRNERTLMMQENIKVYDTFIKNLVGVVNVLRQEEFVKDPEKAFVFGSLASVKFSNAISAKSPFVFLEQASNQARGCKVQTLKRSDIIRFLNANDSEVLSSISLRIHDELKYRSHDTRETLLTTTEPFLLLMAILGIDPASF